VVVVTGDVRGGGTNANVFITLYGSSGDSGRRPLTQKFRDLFERNQTDKFTLKAIDLGELFSSFLMIITSLFNKYMNNYGYNNMY
jgi:hypothetical protein